MSNVERIARRPALAALLLVCGIAMSAQPVQAALAEWRIDPTHSRVIFDVEHAGFSYSLGVLSGPEGQIRFDPDGWDGAEVDVSLVFKDEEGKLKEHPIKDFIERGQDAARANGVPTAWLGFQAEGIVVAVAS
jgi:hypothetical protein